MALRRESVSSAANPSGPSNGSIITAVECAELTATASGGLASATSPAPTRSAARAAIRAADSVYVRSLNIDPNAEQTRRAAISNILDPQTMRTFNFAERNAERRARNQYRPEAVRGR